MKYVGPNIVGERDDVLKYGRRALLSNEPKIEDHFMWGSMPDEFKPDIKEPLLDDIKICDFYVWRADLFEAATYNFELFDQELLPAAAMPTVPMWWAIDERKSKSPRWHSWGNETPVVRLRAIFVSPCKFGCLVFGVYKAVKVDFYHIGIFGGVTLTDMGLKWDKPRSSLMLNAALHFMAQSFVTTEKTQSISRHKHLFGKTEPTTINHIVLRRRQIKSALGSLESGISHDCSWQVRGHWRKLHAPRKSDGALITWVSPCIKGDIDKPLLPPRERMFHINR